MGEVDSTAAKQRGIDIAQADKLVQDKQSKSISGESGGSTIGEERIKAYLSEMSAQAQRVKQGVMTPTQFQTFLDEAKALGVPKERIKAELEASGVKVVSGEEKTIDLERLPDPQEQDYKSLIDRYNGMRGQWIREGKQDKIKASGSLPVGALMNASWTGGRKESKAAFYQM
ncbi:hypothetical protein HY612_04310 [Candidatus Roizmanbacteria bacterium]|nr:hypothetical protein [Candidatus Roizmanbacteria bacterium]